MLNVGIITWYYGANYGAKAQAYALQQTIKELGCNPVMVNYRAPKYRRVNLLTNLNFQNKKKHPILMAKGIVRAIKFYGTKSLFTESRKVSSASEIDALGLDCVILGSDAIFNTRHWLYTDICYGVGIQDTKKITYSPSCEYLAPDTKLSRECVESLRAMVAISVRDENTKRLIYSNTGINAVLTSDPTILYDFHDVQCNHKFPGKFILIYTFSDWSNYRENLREFAKRENCKIVAVGRSCNWADCSFDSAPFQLWISSFRNATYVFTDSFHGTVFALKNKKELILCARPDKQDKIKSLLRDAGVLRGFYDGAVSISEYLNEPLDYKSIGKNLDALRQGSLNYLKGSLQVIEEGIRSGREK